MFNVRNCFLTIWPQAKLPFPYITTDQKTKPAGNMMIIYSRALNKLTGIRQLANGTQWAEPKY